MASAVTEPPISATAGFSAGQELGPGAQLPQGGYGEAQDARNASDTRLGKYLTFLLGPEEFAIQVLKVREIMGIQEITAVPDTPAHVKGVINLRGKVIPVVDLRLKFCMPEKDYTQRTCIIVVQVKAADVPLLTGIIVDEVSEVLNLGVGDIEETPDFGDGGGSAASYLLGMAKVKGKVKILLDIDRVLSSQ